MRDQHFPVPGPPNWSAWAPLAEGVFAGTEYVWGSPYQTGFASYDYGMLERAFTDLAEKLAEASAGVSEYWRGRGAEAFLGRVGEVVPELKRAARAFHQLSFALELWGGQDGYTCCWPVTGLDKLKQDAGDAVRRGKAAWHEYQEVLSTIDSFRQDGHVDYAQYWVDKLAPAEQEMQRAAAQLKEIQDLRNSTAVIWARAIDDAVAGREPRPRD
jgi:uncharacterized protein YukE